MDNVKVKIYRRSNLLRDFRNYEEMFPSTHTKMDEIENALKKNVIFGFGPFGIQVAGEWEDKCYTFVLHYYNAENNTAGFIYMGISKS